MMTMVWDMLNEKQADPKRNVLRVTVVKGKGLKMEKSLGVEPFQKMSVPST